MDRAGAEESDVEPRRFFAPALTDDPTPIELGEEAARHAKVLRLGLGQRVELFDGAGNTLTAQIVSLDRHGLCCAPCASVVAHPRPPKVVLVVCVPRAHKLDDLVRMTTELGVSELRLALSERSVSRPQAERAYGKVSRLERIAREAIRQSENAWAPAIHAPQTLAAVLADAPSQAAKLALLERSDAPFVLPAAASEVWVVVGPEGGLSVADRMELEKRGFAPAALGGAILRSETACVVGVALVLDRLRHQR